MTFCHTTAGNGASFWTHERTNGRTDGWTDRRGSRNSYLDISFLAVLLKGFKVNFFIFLKMCLNSTGSLSSQSDIKEIFDTARLKVHRFTRQVFDGNLLFAP